MSSVLADDLAFCDGVWRRGMAPEEQLTVSQWADRHRILPATSAEPGAWRTDRVPFLRAVMDSLSTGDPVERVVFMKGAQVGGTEAGLNWLGYVIGHAPGLALLVMPSIDMVRRNSRTRIDPMIEATPALRDLVAPAKARERGNTIALKEFPGGQLVLTGANAPTGLRSTPARYLFADEVDAYPADADGEGDPIALAIQRTATFAGRRKIFLCSTPTVKGVSRIDKAYAESDQRKYFVPCPQCGAFQVLEFAQVKWPEGRPAEAHYECLHCQAALPERAKAGMLKAGEWRATAEGDGRTAGYWISALYSPFESWAEIAREFWAVRLDPPRLQTFVNTKLGQVWEDAATAPVIADVLADRAEEFGETLPPAIEVVTAGVDTQNDRLEVELVGWGEGDESWSLGYEVLWGDPASPDVWAELDQVLATRFPRTGLPPLPVAATAIDSGGNRTPEVMAYVQARQGRRVWATKGRGGAGVPPWPKRPPKPTLRRQAPVYIVGVDGLKTALYARLRIEKPGPGYLHFPNDRDFDWYRGLTAERPVRRWVGGVAKIEWLVDSGIRNEPLDCRVYATAARIGLQLAGWRSNAPAPTPQVIKPTWMTRR